MNTAERLEANAEGGQILISGDVVDALGERGKTEQLEKNIKLKGKGEGFEIFVLKGISEN